MEAVGAGVIVGAAGAARSVVARMSSATRAPVIGAACERDWVSETANQILEMAGAFRRLVAVYVAVHPHRCCGGRVVMRVFKVRAPPTHIGNRGCPRPETPPFHGHTQRQPHRCTQVLWLSCNWGWGAGWGISPRVIDADLRNLSDEEPATGTSAKAARFSATAVRSIYSSNPASCQLHLTIQPSNHQPVTEIEMDLWVVMFKKGHRMCAIVNDHRMRVTGL